MTDKDAVAESDVDADGDTEPELDPSALALREVVDEEVASAETEAREDTEESRLVVKETDTLGDPEAVLVRVTDTERVELEVNEGVKDALSVLSTLAESVGVALRLLATLAEGVTKLELEKLPPGDSVLETSGDLLELSVAETLNDALAVGQAEACADSERRDDGDSRGDLEALALPLSEGCRLALVLADLECALLRDPLGERDNDGGAVGVDDGLADALPLPEIRELSEALPVALRLARAEAVTVMAGDAEILNKIEADSEGLGVRQGDGGRVTRADVLGDIDARALVLAAPLPLLLPLPLRVTEPHLDADDDREGETLAEGDPEVVMVARMLRVREFRAEGDRLLLGDLVPLGELLALGVRDGRNEDDLSSLALRVSVAVSLGQPLELAERRGLLLRVGGREGDTDADDDRETEAERDDVRVRDAKSVVVALPVSLGVAHALGVLLGGGERDTLGLAHPDELTERCTEMLARAELVTEELTAGESEKDTKEVAVLQLEAKAESVCVKLLLVDGEGDRDAPRLLDGARLALAASEDDADTDTLPEVVNTVVGDAHAVGASELDKNAVEDTLPDLA